MMDLDPLLDEISLSSTPTPFFIERGRALHFKSKMKA
jgi:hypothetical protein